MQVVEQTSHQIPLDIVTIIVDYVVEDVTTLKNLTLTCRDFCTLGQAHIFSTILLDGNAKRDRLILFEDLLNGDRGQIIAGHIKNLYLLFCDDWFVEEEEDIEAELTHELHEETNDSEQELVEREQLSPPDDRTSKLAFDTMIEFIAKHAESIRCIHIGPFSEIHLDWHDISHNVRNAITHLLVCAEEIALEGFVNIPIILFQSLQNVRSLDVAHVIPSLSSYAYAPWLPPPPSIPSPTSLAIHPGINGFSNDPEDMWDMTNFLRNMTLGKLLNFSNLTTLYLHLLSDPIKYPMTKHLLALCANSLRTLRLYILERHNYDGNVIDFSQLPALQSLTLVADLSGAGSSLRYLSDAINTIGTQQLNDIRLAIDTEDRFRDWTLELSLALATRTPDPWKALLQTKIYQISRGRNVRIAFEFPPMPLPPHILQPEEVFTAIGYILGIDNMESAVKERLVFAIQEVSIKNAFTLRTEAEIRSANVSALKPPLFGNSPHYGWNMFVNNTEAFIEGDDETIPE